MRRATTLTHLLSARTKSNKPTSSTSTGTRATLAGMQIVSAHASTARPATTTAPSAEELPLPA